LYKKDVRKFRVTNSKDGMLDSTAYSFFTNPVFVSRTSNNLGTISLFSCNFLDKPLTRKQTRHSSMILGFSYINSLLISLAIQTDIVAQKCLGRNSCPIMVVPET